MSDTLLHSVVDTKLIVYHMGELSDEKCDMQLGTKSGNVLLKKLYFVLYGVAY